MRDGPVGVILMNAARILSGENNMLYSVVIPCYRSDQTIRKVVELTMEEFRKMGRGVPEFVLVDDCSPDGGKTVTVLRSLVRDYENVRVIELAKNAGQHNAIMAGLNYARGDVIMALDDDMQTHPDQMPKILAELDKGYDIVYGYYPHKKHSWWRNIGTFMNYITVRLLLKKPKGLRTSSFWAIRRFVRDYAVQYPSEFTHLQGLFLRITRNITCVPIEHHEREVGESGYTFGKLFQLWSNIMGFSVVPLRIATRCGFLISFIGVLMAIVIVIRKLLNPAYAIGWPSLMSAICFFSGMNMLFIGLIGEYVGRIFLGVSRNPQFVVRWIDEHGQRPYFIEEGKRYEMIENDAGSLGASGSGASGLGASGPGNSVSGKS